MNATAPRTTLTVSHQSATSVEALLAIPPGSNLILVLFNAMGINRVLDVEGAYDILPSVEVNAENSLMSLMALSLRVGGIGWVTPI